MVHIRLSRCRCFGFAHMARAGSVFTGLSLVLPAPRDWGNILVAPEIFRTVGPQISGSIWAGSLIRSTIEI